MELEWEQKRDGGPASAVPGSVLGGLLGADCLLALAGFGDIPAVLGVSLIAWAVLFRRAGRERKLLIRLLQAVRLEQDPPPAEMEFFLPDDRWLRPISWYGSFPRESGWRCASSASGWVA